MSPLRLFAASASTAASAAAIGVLLGLTGCGGATRESEPLPPPPPPATVEPAASAPPPAVDPKPEPKYTLENNELVLPGSIQFETGKDILKPESEAHLAVVKAYLEDRPDITKLRVEGHTDDVENEKISQKLSEARALAVARWLTGKGVACTRLVPVGFGSQKLTAKTPEARQKNRRVAFVNAQLRNKNIGGMPLEGDGKLAGDLCK